MSFRGWRNVRSALILLYSVVVMANVLPGFNGIPHSVIIPFYLLVPGYVISLVLREDRGIVQTVFFSLVWSVVLVASVQSLAARAPDLYNVPIDGVIPPLTIILTGYAYYHER